ncbi:DUF1343 domain-containing protein [Candidatus Fermentibacteria bacterium]|nr:DUF1343 domain-containing protein [Candidatus Fermentibacteria bacterium]
MTSDRSVRDPGDGRRGAANPAVSGLDRIAAAGLGGRRIALLTHHAAVDSSWRNAADVVHSLPGTELRAILAPQHGFWGETQDNMIEWESYEHPRWGIPVHSLYGGSREPSDSMLSGCDLLLVDLQDVGARYYTYVYAMALSMRRAASTGIPVMILDRPNPLGLRIVEGRPQEPGMLSYVGLYPIPVRHAMTIGELARLFAHSDGLPTPEVIAFEADCTEGLPERYPWVLPSPNMPTPETALVYPGMCLFEATNISEGRGTTRPFEVFGAPWIDPDVLCGELEGHPMLEGSVLRPHRFVPAFGKHAGVMCGGARIHPIDPASFRPLRAGLALLAGCFRFRGSAWREPPYEYVWDRMPMDILAGTADARRMVETGDFDGLAEFCSGDPEAHSRLAGPHLIYPREFSA